MEVVLVIIHKTKESNCKISKDFIKILRKLHPRTEIGTLKFTILSYVEENLQVFGMRKESQLQSSIGHVKENISLGDYCAAVVVRSRPWIGQCRGQGLDALEIRNSRLYFNISRHLRLEMFTIHDYLGIIWVFYQFELEQTFRNGRFSR